MKAREIPAFRKWLNVMLALDPRLNATDFNTLQRVYLNSRKT